MLEFFLVSYAIAGVVTLPQIVSSGWEQRRGGGQKRVKSNREIAREFGFCMALFAGALGVMWLFITFLSMFSFWTLAFLWAGFMLVLLALLCSPWLLGLPLLFFFMALLHSAATAH